MTPLQPLPPSKPPLLGATLLFSAALGLACLLAWHALTGNMRLAGCGGAADCGALAATRWASWGPVPVALPAVALYAAAVGCLLVLDRLRTAKGTRHREGAVWTALVALSLVALGAGLWFAGLQVLVLRRYCTLCLATHLCASLGGGLVLCLAAGPGRGISGLRWRVSALAATGALVLLVAGQLLLLPRSVSAAPALVATAAFPSIVISQALPARELVLVNGRVHLDAAAYPALAASSAPAAQVIAVMFDYTCEACRANHALLTETITHQRPGLNILLIPTPLDPACNPAVERLRPEHVNACVYARYALAVWKAAPERFAAYDAWLMSGGGSVPPPIDAARSQAQALVGVEAFRRALAMPELDRLLHHAGKIYQMLEAGEIPKLLLPRRVVAGDFVSSAQWQQALEE